MLCYVEYYAEILISKLLGAFIKAMCKNLKILCLFVGQNFFLSFVSSWFCCKACWVMLWLSAKTYIMARRTYTFADYDFLL